MINEEPFIEGPIELNIDNAKVAQIFIRNTFDRSGDRCDLFFRVFPDKNKKDSFEFRVWISGLCETRWLNKYYSDETDKRNYLKKCGLKSMSKNKLKLSEFIDQKLYLSIDGLVNENMDIIPDQVIEKIK